MSIVDERVSKRIPAKAFSTKTALRLIADVRGLQIGAVKQTLTIGIADVETAMLLGISLNAPVACVQRVALDQDGVVVLLTDGIYRGDVVKLEMNLKTPTAGFPDASAK